MNSKTACFLIAASLVLAGGIRLLAPPGSAAAQPVISARKAPLLKIDGLVFKDLNKNGVLDRYEDWRLPVDQRIADLVSKMTLEEKVGLMFHPNIAVTEKGVIPQTAEEMRALMEAQAAARGAARGAPAGAGPARGAAPGGAVRGAGAAAGVGFGQMAANAPPPRVYIVERHFRSILNNGVAPPDVFARWSNGMQEMAEATRLGIPIMFSTDPRHGAYLGAHVSGAQYFSQWPGREGQLGLAASRDLELAREFGRVTAEEYRAVGLHMILGPQIDLTTEPRWGRNAGGFSEDAQLTAEMVKAYLEGAQGKSVGPGKILAMIKHFPGSGPHKGGSGRQLVYPGNNFDYHLIPWRAAFEAGAIAVMGYYSGTPFDNGLAVNYSRYIMTDVLRGKLKFDGVVCTDWGVISRTGPLREDLVNLPLKERYKMSIDAGVDQFGSETDPAPVIELVKEGRISQERINQAASRILRWHFLLGLFENPYVDPEAAPKIVRSERNQKLGYQAQLKSIVLLANNKLLPLPEKVQNRRARVFVSGLDENIVRQYADVASDPKQADFALLRVESVRGGFRPGAEAEEVSIEFPAETMAEIRKITETGVPTAVAVNLGSTLVVLPKELLSSARATLMTFDVVDSALLDVVFGRFKPAGKLPFELPSSMEAVRNQKEDVPFDSRDPLFKFGFGLTY